MSKNIFEWKRFYQIKNFLPIKKQQLTGTSAAPFKLMEPNRTVFTIDL